MKNTQVTQVSVEQTVSIVCDRCQKLVPADEYGNWAGTTLTISGCFSSAFDDHYTFDVCDECTGKTLDFLNVSKD